MIVSAILVGILLVVGTVLYIHHRFTDDGDESDVTTVESKTVQSEQECCGLHITCEKDSLVAGIDKDLLYYDDEELDRFIGREESDYNAAEIEEFREVLLTLRPEDIAGWARSVAVRQITLPVEVRDELFMIVSEARESNKG